MRRALLIALAALSCAAAPAAAATEPSARYVVALEPGAAATPTAVAAQARVPVDAVFAAVASPGFATRMTSSQASAVAERPGVAFVEPDRTFEAAGTAKPGGGGTAPEIVPPGIRRVGGTPAGLPRQPAGGAVAVLDTGVDLTSPELDARSGTNCITPGAPASDDNGHGTHVAGIIAARANSGATVGVAPATRVYAVKVLNSRSKATLSQLLCGLDWVAANAAQLGIRVVNMSVTAPGSDDGACGNVAGDSLHRSVCALARAGVLVVAAAGNGSVALENAIPAAYPEALAVTAMADTDGLPGAKGAAPSCIKGEADDRRASFSNFATTLSAQAHTLAAPGVCIQSTGIGSSATATFYGTSQAAPHAAAAAALCVSDGGVAGPCAGLSPAGIIQRLRADALSGPSGFAGDPATPVSGRYYGPLVSAATY